MRNLYEACYTLLLLFLCVNALDFLKQEALKVKKLFFLLIVLFVSGCSSTALKSTGLRHESSEDRLLTKQEFMERASKSATFIYEGLRAINDAANLYAIDNNGSLPSGNTKLVESLLLDGGYLKTWPVIPAFAFTDPVQYDLRYSNGYANMDGLGEADDVIYAQDLKIEVCEEFIRHYSSVGPGEIIHDYEAYGNKYPGEVLGRHVEIYAITWSMARSPDYCDIEWVMQYNVPPPPRPGSQ